MFFLYSLCVTCSFVLCLEKVRVTHNLLLYLAHLVDPLYHLLTHSFYLLKLGAYKTVYRAFDSDEALEVAWNKLHVERLSKHELEKVSNEVKLLERIQHKNIIRFHALLPSTERNGVKSIDFITEQMTSGTLKDYLKRAKAIKLKVIRRWSFNILGAISYLHTQNPPIMHRDLKCDNIFINGHVGEVKIGDLGLSGVKLRDKADSVIGTPEFMAPEVYDGKYTEKVDIYAFGMCLLEMVTMEYPYSECSSFAQIFKKVYSGEKPQVLDRILPGPFKNVINACLQREANRPSASQLLEDPLFKDWNSDEGTQNNISLLVGSNDNRNGDANNPGGNPSDIQGGVIEWSDPLDRALMVSTVNDQDGQTGPSISDQELKPLEVSVLAQVNETGGFKVGLTIPIENQIKRVEFPFDPFIDTAEHLARELVEVFHLPEAQIANIEKAIEEQIKIARKQREAHVRNATPHATPHPPSNNVQASHANQTANAFTDTGHPSYAAVASGTASSSATMAPPQPAQHTQSETSLQESSPPSGPVEIVTPPQNDIAHQEPVYQPQQTFAPPPQPPAEHEQLQYQGTPVEVTRSPVDETANFYSPQNPLGTQPSQPVEQIQAAQPIPVAQPQVHEHPVVQQRQHVAQIQQPVLEQQHVTQVEQQLAEQQRASQVEHHIAEQQRVSQVEQQIAEQQRVSQVEQQLAEQQHVSQVEHQIADQQRVTQVERQIAGQHVQQVERHIAGQQHVSQVEHQIVGQQHVPQVEHQIAERKHVSQAERQISDRQHVSQVPQVIEPQNVAQVHRQVMEQHQAVEQQHAHQVAPQVVKQPNVPQVRHQVVDSQQVTVEPTRSPVDETGSFYQTQTQSNLLRSQQNAAGTQPVQLSQPVEQIQAAQPIPVAQPQAREHHVVQQRVVDQHHVGQLQQPVMEQHRVAQVSQPVVEQSNVTQVRQQVMDQQHAQPVLQQVVEQPNVSHVQRQVMEQQQVMEQRHGQQVPQVSQRVVEQPNVAQVRHVPVMTQRVQQVVDHQRVQQEAERQLAHQAVEHQHAQQVIRDLQHAQQPVQQMQQQLHDRSRGLQRVSEVTHGPPPVREHQHLSQPQVTEHQHLSHQVAERQHVQQAVPQQVRESQPVQQQAPEPQYFQGAVPEHRSMLQQAPHSRENGPHSRLPPTAPSGFTTTPTMMAAGSSISHSASEQVLRRNEHGTDLVPPHRSISAPAGSINADESMQYLRASPDNNPVLSVNDQSLLAELTRPEPASVSDATIPLRTALQPTNSSNVASESKPPSIVVVGGSGNDRRHSTTEKSGRTSRPSPGNISAASLPDYAFNDPNYVPRSSSLTVNASDLPKRPYSLNDHLNLAPPITMGRRSSSWRSTQSETSFHDAGIRASPSDTTLGSTYDQKWLASCLELMEHSAKGRYPMVQQKLDLGIPPSFADYDRRTPLHVASSRGHLDIVTLLIDRGANMKAVDRWGRTPLSDAIMNRHQNVASFLRSHGATEDMDVTSDAFGSITLESVAKGDLEEVRSRLVAGANANFADYDKRTALHLACTEGHLDIAELLLVNEADWTAKDSFGRTPVDDAVTNGHKEILRVLRQYGAEIPRHLSGAHSDTQHQMGLDLVENAAKGRINAVKKCLLNGANPNFQDYDKRTALHLAAVEGHADIVEVLLRSGADSNSLDRWGETPKCGALKEQKTAVVDEFLNWEKKLVRRNSGLSARGSYPNGRRIESAPRNFEKQLVEDGVNELRSLGLKAAAASKMRPSHMLFADSFMEHHSTRSGSRPVSAPPPVTDTFAPPSGLGEQQLPQTPSSPYTAGTSPIQTETVLKASGSRKELGIGLEEVVGKGSSSVVTVESEGGEAIATEVITSIVDEAVEDVDENDGNGGVALVGNWVGNDV